MKLLKQNIVVSLLLIFHLIGMLGLSFQSSQDVFLFLTPYHLLFTFILIFTSKNYTKKFFQLTALIFLLGFFVEVLGVYSGFLFGDYVYGDGLGLKIFKVPLVIGLNWFILVYASRGIVNYFLKNNVIQVLLSSLLMVLLDLLIEPVAITFEWWFWGLGYVPFSNYLMWFLVAFVMQIIISLKKYEISKSIAISLFLAQLIFFTYLNIIVV